MYDLALVNGRCYIDGEFIDVNIYIKGKKIQKISKELLSSEEFYDCSGLEILPGLIDPHVHFNLNLGEFISSDDFESGSIAAAYGGITTFIDFLDPISVNSEFDKAVEDRRKLAKNSYVDYSFHATLGNYSDELKGLYEKLKHEGISSIKVFTTYSDSDRRCNDDVIKEIMMSDFLLMVHAENDELVNSHWTEISTYEQSRPTISEKSEVVHLCKMLKDATGKLYIVHVSSGKTLLKIKNNFDYLLKDRLFIESCPQYFYLTSDKFAEDDGAKFLLAPPLRREEERLMMLENIDTLFSIGTDHCPFKLEEKLRYRVASKVPKGLGGIEYSFLLMRDMFGDKIIEKHSINPATVFGLIDKGKIEAGYDADFAIFDPNQNTVVSSGHSKSDYSPYDGLTLKGKHVSTLVRGKFVVKDGELIENTGEFIRRKV